MASAGTDGLVRVWDRSKRADSYSAAKEAPAYDEDESGCILTCTGLEGRSLDSVYNVAWGRRQRWVLASLSYDGRFIINTVPSSVRYGIISGM